MMDSISPVGGGLGLETTVRVVMIGDRYLSKGLIIIRRFFCTHSCIQCTDSVWSGRAMGRPFGWMQILFFNL